MAYSDFTLERVAEALAVTTREADLFPGPPAVEVPDWLRQTLAKRTQLSLISEKSRSEFIVVPILLASRDLSPTPLAIYSGQRLDVDPGRGLVGECDFILAAAPAVPPLRAPIATIVEAKKNDIESGLGPCVAQMVAAEMFNQSAGHAAPVYGCVTTGEVWQFLELTGTTAAIDQRRYYLDDVRGILGVIQAIISRAHAAGVPRSKPAGF
jgi:hypothetical protein